MTSPNLVEMDAVAKRYPMSHSGGARLRLLAQLLLRGKPASSFVSLEDINLRIKKGESWGIIGANGAGKSTLLKIVAGVIRPTEGTCRVNARVAAMLELGAGFQAEHTGRENILLSAALHGWTRRETRERLESVIEFADIGEYIDQPVRTYSTGMAVRLGFAMISAMNPDLLITDEVLAVGDESFQKKCLRWMESYLQQGGALLLCSHSMYHIQSLCQKALWLEHGRCAKQGDVFPVTQAYAAFMEAKSPKQAQLVLHRPQAEDSSQTARLTDLFLCNSRGDRTSEFEMGEDIVLRGEFQASEHESAVVMAGIVRVDGTPVYGTFSSDAAYRPHPAGPGRFAFEIRFPQCPLLPGRYRFRAHTLDRHGLRMYDTMEIEANIAGRTREHGVVRLRTEWR